METMQLLLSWRSPHGKTNQPLVGFRVWAYLLPATALLALLFSIASTSFAGNATWLANPTTGDWNTAANWTAGGPPNGPSDTATFDVSSIAAVAVAANTEVDSIVFDAGASAFTITLSPGPSYQLTISGAGIANNSGLRQNFIATIGAILFTNSATAGSLTSFTTDLGGGALEFLGTSTAGSATVTNGGSSFRFQYGGLTYFMDSSTAGNGTFINYGASVGGAFGGSTTLFDTSTAGDGTFIINGSAFLSAGGFMRFDDDSTGGTARLEIFNNGTLDISFHHAPGVTTGSIEGSGFILLGFNNLTVGSNNLSTSFSGKISSSGSLTKIGNGKLTLSQANTYSGGTTVNKGALLVTNRTDSATGTGAVQVNKGTLGGTGIIDGAVTVGTGSSSGAIILPGKSTTNPGTLTIDNTLTFNSRSTYKCVLSRRAPIAGEVTALGVTISSTATFTFSDVGTGTLIGGTVFTVINNTSSNPIVGTFSNLADGSIFTSNGNNFQVSYEGGDGNDLTLTVLP